MVKQVAPAFFRSHRILPLDVRDDVLHVVMATPAGRVRAARPAAASGLQVSPAIGLESEIDAALARAIEGEGGDDAEADEADAASASDFVEHLRDLASEAPVIRLVNVLVSRVTDLRASTSTSSRSTTGCTFATGSTA